MDTNISVKKEAVADGGPADEDQNQPQEQQQPQVVVGQQQMTQAPQFILQSQQLPQQQQQAQQTSMEPPIQMQQQPLQAQHQQQQHQPQQDSVPLQQQPLNEIDHQVNNNMGQSSHQTSSQATHQEPDQHKAPPVSSTSHSGGAPTLTKGNIIEAIKEFDSSIPDAVVHHFLNVAGMQTNDQRIIRLIAIAAQKFIHDVVSDSLQHCKLRGAQNKKTKDKKYTLSIEDLTSALAEYGIEIKRQHYFN